MGLFDQISDLVSDSAGGGGGGMRDKLVGSVMDMVGKDGVQGLVSRFDAAGLADLAKSWVGTGDNKNIDAAQVRQALGSEKLGAMARDAGVTDDQAAEGLAGVLPQLIDKLTPGGGMPDLGELQKLAGKFLNR